MTRQRRKSLEAFLVASARLGDRASFERLVVLWQPRLSAHAWLLLGDQGRVRDVVQDGWVEIVRGLPRLKDDRAFGAWALRIVTRRCAHMISSLQSQRRLNTEFAAEPTARAAEPDPDRHVDFDRVAQALEALPAPQRAAMALFYLEDMSIAEVAIALDVPAGTVKTRLMHARETLRSRLDGGQDE